MSIHNILMLQYEIYYLMLVYSLDQNIVLFFEEIKFYDDSTTSHRKKNHIPFYIMNYNVIIHLLIVIVIFVIL